jgi:taurine dioxygenase
VLIKPFTQSLGAEIIGLNDELLHEPDVAHALRAGLYEHLLLVVKGQRLKVNGLVDLARIFGQPEIAWDVGSRHPGNPYIQVMNSTAQPSAASRTSSQFWHTDGSFLPRPTLITLLAIQELPHAGGDTLFVDTRSAYQALPQETQECIRPLQLRYSYHYQLSGFQTKKYGAGYQNTSTEYPDVLHPLVRGHPVTGRGSLYLDQLCVAGVQGKPEAESREMLEFLYAHTLNSRRIYQHSWEDGDLLVWDNPSLMHRRGAHHQGTRLLYRTTVAGPEPQALTNKKLLISRP